jgi:hypothetical protein
MTEAEFEEVMDSLFERGLVRLVERDGELALALTFTGLELAQQIKRASA